MLRVLHPVLHARTDSDVIDPVGYRTRVHVLQYRDVIAQSVSPADHACVAWLGPPVLEISS